VTGTADRTIPTFDDVRAAAERIAGVAHRTPVLRSRIVDEMVGGQVFFKCENFQRAGVFKFRGAYNALAQLSAEQRRAGVVTYSSGNHAQALSLAARLLGIPATIVMPQDAPAVKVAATAGYGGDIVRYDRYTQDYGEIARALAAEHGLTLIPPVEHPHVVAGQGTAALELFEEVGELDALFVPVGGGGLFSGSVLSAQAMAPECRLHGVEPEAGNDGQRSLREGRRITIATPQTIADGAQTRFLDPLPFEILMRARPTMLTATDDELVECMRIFAGHLKIVVEPTGCLGLAAVRSCAEQLRDQRIGVVISGGNVDLDRFAALVGTSRA
jgi:threo-3-hydroxy-L-aspartate ammonia-lyase